MLFGSNQFCAENPFDFFTTKTTNMWKQQMQVVTSRSRSIKAAHSSPAHLFKILCICWRPVISLPAKYRKCTFMSFHYHRHYVKLTAILWDLLWDCSAWAKTRAEIQKGNLLDNCCTLISVLRCAGWVNGIPARAEHTNHNSVHARVHSNAIYLIVFGTECIACIYYIKKRKWRQKMTIVLMTIKQVFCTSLYSQLHFCTFNYDIWGEKEKGKNTFPLILQMFPLTIKHNEVQNSNTGTQPVYTCI